VDGTASSAGSADFTAQSVNITFLAGAIGPATFLIPITTDATAESNETFSIHLTNISLVDAFANNDFVVTIVNDDADTTAPTLDLSDITTQATEATSAAGAAVAFPTTASDLVDGSVPVTFKEGTTIVHSGDIFALGTHAITASATDAAGNTSTDTFTINILPLHLVGTPNADSYTALAGSEIIDAGGGIDTITFGFKLIDATVSYSGNTVTIDGPSGSHTVLRGFEIFNFADGTVNNVDGSPLVDDLFYYANNHDVWNAHADADVHFAVYGWKEGRDPNAFFSTKGYLDTYADVKNAGVNPLLHYDVFGWKEGRDPSPQFDTKDYLATNSDVKAAGVDPLAHFLLYGDQEQRHAVNDGVWG
jgi:hypothetical protein